MSHGLFTDEFVRLIQAPRPDYGEIKRQIILAYNAEKGASVREDIDPRSDEAREVAGWLNQLLAFDPQAHFYTRRPALLAVFSPELASKIGSLAQHYCPLCEGEGS